MLSYLWAYVLTLPVLVLLDVVWVGYLARSFYVERLSQLLSGSLVLPPVVAWYLLYLGALFYFAVIPARSFSEALLSGALLGLAAYGTYNLVNMATLKGWPLSVTLLDILWGSLLTAVVAGAGFYILGFFSN